MMEAREGKFERLVEIPLDRYEDLLDTESKWWILAEAVRTYGVFGVKGITSELVKLLFSEELTDHQNAESEDGNA